MVKKGRREQPDYSRLREKQLERFCGVGEILDRNPEGYKERTYDTLKRIKFPLILDYTNPPVLPPLVPNRKWDDREVADIRNWTFTYITPSRKPWTVEEVLKAMEPAIKSLVREYTGKRPGYQPEDAESDGMKAVLDALWTDKGLAWFAGYCYEKIEAAIRRGAKNSGTIRAPERMKQWRDNIVSTDLRIGEGDATVGEFIGAHLAIPQKMVCGDYRIDKNGDPELVKKTCKKGKIGDKICDRCKGTGLIVVFRERIARTADEITHNRERIEEAKAIWDKISAVLTPRQKEVMELRYGIGGQMEVNPEEIARILQERTPREEGRLPMVGKTRVQQLIIAATKKLKEACRHDPSLVDSLFRALGEEEDERT